MGVLRDFAPGIWYLGLMVLGHFDSKNQTRKILISHKNL